MSKRPQLDLFGTDPSAGADPGETSKQMGRRAPARQAQPSGKRERKTGKDSTAGSVAPPAGATEGRGTGRDAPAAGAATGPGGGLDAREAGGAAGRGGGRDEVEAGRGVGSHAPAAEGKPGRSAGRDVQAAGPAGGRGTAREAPAGAAAAGRGAGLDAEAAEGQGLELPAPRVLSVGELARRIRGTLEADFGSVLVRGEISNLRQPASGHLYFSLKDRDASIRAVLFRGQARYLRFRPENGQEVVARGRLSFYEAGGDAQIVCEGLEPVGAGALALAFEQLKARLAKEGLFDRERKRPIPFLPWRIGVVTSPTGAAIRDFLRVLHRRFPGLQVLIAPARVQGAGAAEEIARGIERLGARGDLDVIVVTRGGGSVEDLWAFNEEVVARAIAAAPLPVVSAVGHEVDFTIADFVADLRAPTPTGAAELLAPVEADLRAALAVARGRLAKAIRARLEREAGALHRRQSLLGDPRHRLGRARLELDGKVQRAAVAARRLLSARWQRLEALQERLRRQNPALRWKVLGERLQVLREGLLQAALRRQRQERSRQQALLDRLWRQQPGDRLHRERLRLAELQERLRLHAAHLVPHRRAALEQRVAELRALSPLRVLSRGFSVAFAASGAVLLSPEQVRAGERIHLELAEGALEVEVIGEAPPKK